MAKTIVFLGSSVTCGGDGYSMTEYVRENTDHTCIKWAISGTTLADVEEKSYVSRMKKEMANQDECDLFITQLSTNDAARGLPLGDVAATKDKTTFATETITGAMEYIIASAKEKWNCPVAFYTGTKFEKLLYQQMVDRLYDLKEKWGIDIIDLWNDEEMNSVSPEDRERYMHPDGVHPKREGYELWWGPKFAEYVKQNFIIGGNRMKTFTKNIDRNLSADVLVAGGGVGGCAAAIAAARKGAKVILAEESGCLGGQAGFGLVTPVGSIVTMSGKSFGGLVEEIWQGVKEETTKYCIHNPQHEDSYIASPHIVKYVLLKLATEAGVEVRFHTSLIDAVSENGGVTEAILIDRSGMLSVSAKIFIDGTGDGNLIALSGGDYVIGSEEDAYASLEDNGLNKVHCQEGTYEGSKEKALQPVSIFFTMGNVDMEEAMSYNNKALKFEDLGITKEEFKKWKFAGTCGFEDNGDLIPLPQGRILVSYAPAEGTAVLNMSRVTGIDGSDADSLNEGEIKAQLQLIAIVDFLKTFVPAFKDSYLIQSACSLGIRETRRLVGIETLNGGDVITAKQIENPIARGSYIIDIHDPKGKSMAIGGAIKGDFYDIPYGTLVSVNRHNLMACGRCISADHVAHSSSRIQGTCVMTGQAAGTAAAICVKDGILPKDVDAQKLREILIKDGVYLD